MSLFVAVMNDFAAALRPATGTWPATKAGRHAHGTHTPAHAIRRPAPSAIG
jgi:hypothetical protein